MKITCDSCGAKYTIADDKVRGRKVKIRCKGCGTPIVVDGQQEEASAAPEDASSNETEATVPLEAPAPSSDYPPAEGEWSVNLSETDQRTLTTAQIVEGWRDGTVTVDAFVWRDGMADWIPILESPELSPLLRDDAAAPPPANPAVPPSSPLAAQRPPASAARVAGGRAQGAPDLFAGVERAGAEEDISTSAPALPQAGTRPYEDDRLTGARNENSVLFSLDALKAGFAGPPAKSPSPQDRRGAPTAGDPFGMGAGGLPGITSAPRFSLADNQALLTAPPPPEPPRPVESVFTPGGGPSAAPLSSKRNLILLGSGAVVLLVAGLALGIGIGGKDEGPETAGSAAPSAVAAGDTKPEAEAASEKTDDKPAEKAEKAEDQPAETTKPASDAKTEEAAPTKSTSASAGTPRKETAAPKKEEPKPAPAGDQPFNRSAAIAALSTAAGQASSCKRIGGPTGSGKVSVTFAPSGRATSANVMGAPFSGTAVGGCIAGVFRRAKVPPFSGNSLTVSKSFTIN